MKREEYPMSFLGARAGKVLRGIVWPRPAPCGQLAPGCDALEVLSPERLSSHVLRDLRPGCSPLAARPSLPGISHPGFATIYPRPPAALPVGPFFFMVKNRYV